MSYLEGIWIINEKGREEFLAYEDIEEDLLSKVLKPKGGFIYSAEDFKHLPLASTPFWVEGWLPAPGKAMIFAKGKVGKSYLAQQLARCIGAGEPFLGIPVHRGSVLYLQFEVGTSILQDRLRSTGKNYPNVYVGTSFAMKLDTTSGQDQFKRAIDIVKPNVVLVDPFYKMFQGEEDKSHDVKIVLDTIDQAIEAFNCSVVLFHHGGKDLSRGARGSSTFEDWPDSYIELKRTSTSGQLRIRITPKLLRHAELPPDSIEAVLDNFEFRLTEKVPTVREKVKAWLESHGGKASIDEMVIAELGSRRAVYGAVKELCDENITTKLGQGRVCLTPEITT
jgi:hypothetical protein